jgi:hypothetical protein
MSILLGALVVPHAGASLEASGRASPVTHHVPRSISEITVDGALNEPAWSGALPLELEYEVRPGENVAPPVRTLLLVTFDELHVYFGFRAFDPEPDRIRARFSDRDEAWGDDWVGIVLDTFNDQRRAYELLCNPLGVQMDALNDDVLHDYDDSWNATWESGGRITDGGYEVEMAVPYNQIRFQNTNGGPQTWGFDAIRSYPRSDRHHIGLFPRDRSNNSYLSQTVKLVGMEGASPGRNLEVLPTLTTVWTEEGSASDDGAMERGDFDPELGATVRWGITPNVTLNGAVNPDFSQVEADVLQLNINQQFALFFPETRPFFLEGADYFNTPLDLVHTRVIADPDVAGKLTGKQGRHTYGIFSVQDETTTMVFPGPEGSSSATFDLETAGTVGRYRYDFGRNSTVGAAYTDRRGGDYLNQVASVDTALRFTEADRIAASLSVSDTRYSEEMLEEAALRDDTFRDGLLQFEYEHSVRNGEVQFIHNQFGEEFRADLGFIPQVGFNEWRLSGARVWWGEDGDFHRRLIWGGAASYREHQNGELLDQYVDMTFEFYGPRESVLQIIIRNQEEQYEGVRFKDELYGHSQLEVQATENLNLFFHVDHGDAMDLSNVQPAKLTKIEPRVKYNLGRRSLLLYHHTYQTLDVDGGQLFRVHAPEVRFVYQFNTRAFIRAILQYTDIRRNTSLYEEAVEPRTRDLNRYLLFAYKLDPQTAFYAGYSDQYAGTEENGLTRASRAVFVKLAYAWRR